MNHGAARKFSIREVSEICNIPSKTLRYYDEIGLVVPAFRDESNRYRYYGKDQIRVNAVGPSTVETLMLQKTFDSLEDPEKALEESLAFNPMGRFGTVEDIAKTCLFLASDESAYISGQTIMVDGGQINKVSRPLSFD